MDKYQKRIGSLTTKRNKYQDELTTRKLDLFNTENNIVLVRNSIIETNKSIAKSEEKLKIIAEVEEEIEKITSKFKKKRKIHLVEGVIISIILTSISFICAMPLSINLITLIASLIMTCALSTLKDKLNEYAEKKPKQKIINDNPKYYYEAQLKENLKEKRKAKNYLKKLKTKSKNTNQVIIELEKVITALNIIINDFWDLRAKAIEYTLEGDIDDYYYKDKNVTEIIKRERKIKYDNKQLK